MRHPSRAWLWSALFGAGVSLAACASSDEDAGSGGSGGTAGTAGTAGAAGSGGSGATGGSGGSAGSAGSGGTAGSAGAAGSGGTGGTIDFDAGPPVAISGATVNLDGSPIADMKVCVYGASSIPCVMTNSIGYYEITGVPGNNELLLEFTKPTYYPVLRTITTDTADMDIGSIQYPTEAQANLFGTLAGGITLDKTKGQVLAIALKTVVLADGGTVFDGQEGVSVAMTPKSGMGPFYTTGGATPLPDPNATMTSDAGLALFANVNPGEVEIEMTHPTKTCTRYVASAWKGSTSTASRVPIIPGYVIGGAVLQCPP